MNESKSLRLVDFDVKKGHVTRTFDRWFELFMAQATLRGYDVVAGSEPEVPTDEDYKTGQDASDIDKALRDANKKGFNELLLCCRNNVTALSVVRKAKTKKYAGGLLSKALSDLRTEFEPTGMLEKADLMRSYGDAVLLNGEDPSDFLTKVRDMVSKLQTEYGVVKDDTDVMMHVLSRLPKEYEVDRAICLDRVDSGTLDMDTLGRRLNTRFKNLYPGGNLLSRPYLIPIRLIVVYVENVVIRVKIVFS